MNLGAPESLWEWRDLTKVFGETSGWAHPGLDFAHGSFFSTDPARPEIVSFDQYGSRLRSFSVDAREIHGIAVDSGTLWLADPGEKQCIVDGQQYEPILRPDGGQVVNVDLEGRVLQVIAQPDLPAYSKSEFRPTSIVAEDDLWIADGYGADLVHRYSRTGERLSTIGLGDLRLNNPHSIAWDDRSGPRLLIADRGNSQILAVDPATESVTSTIGLGDLHRPSGMTVWQEYLVVADLSGQITVFGGDDRIVAHLGLADTPVIERPGWPNAIDHDRVVAPSPSFGTFNSPHDVAVTPDGTLVVCEWMVGGRLTALHLPSLLGLL